MIIRERCRVDNGELIELFDLGEFYLSHFHDPNLPPQQPKVPLVMCMGKDSKIVQLKHSAPSSNMYEEYWYRSGMNQTMAAELKSIVASVTESMTLKEKDIVVDIGCNDGTLVKNYPKHLTIVGFDPAKNLYQYSSQYTTKTITTYFSSEEYFKHFQQKAKVVTSIAMFYDLEDPNKFVSDIYNVLDQEGLWIIQMSYLPLMLKQMAFDNICHEHLEYYSLQSLTYLLERHNFKVVDCQLNDINGGSFRIYMRKKDANPLLFSTAQYRDVADFRVQSILAYEKNLKLDQAETYIRYFEEMRRIKQQTMDFLKQEKARGKKVLGYGASTKGNTLLQWYGIDHQNKFIEKIAERNPDKWGKVTIGTNIPICSEEEARQEQPDYLFVLPWHFRYEFLKRETAFLERGGKFIFPLPKFEVVGLGDF